MLLLATFALAVVTSRLGLRRKTLLGIAEERGGRRGAGNAIANTGVAAAAAVLGALSYAQRCRRWSRSSRRWRRAAAIQSPARSARRGAGARGSSRRCGRAARDVGRDVGRRHGRGPRSARSGSGRWASRSASSPPGRSPPIVVGATIGVVARERAGRDARSAGHPQQRRAELPQHRDRGGRRRLRSRTAFR